MADNSGMVSRILPFPKQSFFLFGPRGVGKTTYLENQITKKTLYIDLLDADSEESYSRSPDLLFQIISEDPKKYSVVIIDEIQKIPKLLDIVHKSIFKYKHIQFILTGSSARKLKRGLANLLAGRAFSIYLHPFCYLELEKKELVDLLSWGGLPQIYSYDNDKDKIRYLKTYTQTYLKEEIQVEQLVRNMTTFRQFLDFATQMNGEITNFSNIAKKSAVDETTISRYFEILVDTMVGFYLEPFEQSVRKRQAQKPKFYLFDTGVVRSLNQSASSKLIIGSSEYGKLFEQFIICEIRKLNDYFETDYRFFYLRTKDNVEVDLIIQKRPNQFLYIEIKSTNQVLDEDLKSLNSLAGENERWIICTEKAARKHMTGVRVLPWKVALRELFREF